jgi:hypothetical protein
VEFLRTVRFRTSRASVVVTVEEAKAFQHRLSQAPGGRPLEHQIQLAIDHRSDVTIPDAHKAAAVRVLATWFDEAGEVSREMGELLVMLNEA